MNLLFGKNGLRTLTEDEITRIIDTAIGLLDRHGVMIDNDRIVQRLADFGGTVTKGNQVHFSENMLRDFLASREKVVLLDEKVQFSGMAEIYQGYYLDPFTNEYLGWTEERLLNYVKLAKHLPFIGNASMLGCPIRETPVDRQPLYEKYYCWAYDFDGGCAIWETKYCDPIYEMYQIIADEKKQPIGDLFCGAVYLISPLRFLKEEADQFMYFYDRGLRVSVGTNSAMGAQIPVTPAGALALHLAEHLFINILNAAFFDDRRLSMGCAISTLNMRNGAFMYGRPEKTICNLGFVQIARRLGASCSLHTGLTDAKLPNAEASAQKLLSMLPAMAVNGKASIAAGLLAADEVFSPIQLIFDNELLNVLNHISSGVSFDADALDLDALI